jgi:hypothetical protein
MTTVQALFVNAIGEYKLKKARLNWYLGTKEIVSGIDLQCSQWNDRKGFGRHYLNFGCFVRALDHARRYEGKVPPASSFHVRARAGNLLPGQYVDHLPCLDDKASISPESRDHQIRALLCDHIVPTLSMLSTEAGMCEAYRKKILPEFCFAFVFGQNGPWRDKLRQA